MAKAAGGVFVSILVDLALRSLASPWITLGLGAEGDTLLQVELSEQAVADYEWIEEDEPYREWLVLADLIDGQASVHVVDEGKV